MKQSENISALSKAICEAQAEFDTMPKDSKGYGYNYTSLDTITATIRPILAKHGLGYVQPISSNENGALCIVTRVFNTAGEFMEWEAALPSVAMAKTNAAQNLGAAITYMRRYCLCSFLGITSDEDVDGNFETFQKMKNQNAPAAPRQAPPQRQQPQPPRQAPQRQAPVPKGGEDTPEERSEINNLLGATRKDGTGIFNQKDIDEIPRMRLRLTAMETINYLKNQIAARRQEEAPADDFQDDLF